MKRKNLARLALLALAMLVLLTACGGRLPFFEQAPAATPSAVAPTGPATTAGPGASPQPGGETQPAGPIATSSPGASSSPSVFPGDTPPPPALTLWVPPDFDPASGTPAGDLLAARLDQFRAETGANVQVRVKAPNGTGGLLESLNAASAAAPLALPSVVALSRPDLEAAALKELIFPLDGISTAIDEPDWYTYARQLAMVQGATYGLPFAGDALVIAYRPGMVVGPPADWDAIFRLGQPLAFPVGDPQGLFALSLYQALGGPVEDAQRRPTLQPEVLSRVLQVLSDGEQRGIFPFWLSQYETSGQAWQSYRDGRVNAVVTWSSYYLSTLPADTAAAAVPPLDDSPMALATGWSWAVADPDPDHRQLAAQLAEFLSKGDFLAGWSEASGYLPTRPSSLASWSSANLRALLSPIATSAQARPTVDQLSSLGPVLNEATLKVLKRESDPTQAAQAAAERLTAPDAR